MPEKNTCFTCKWWNVTGPGKEQLGKNKGICYLNPPTPIPIPMANPIARQVVVNPVGIRPTTGAMDYCHGYRSDLVKK